MKEKCVLPDDDDDVTNLIRWIDDGIYKARYKNSTDAKKKPDRGDGATTDVDNNTQNSNVKSERPRSIPSNWKKTVIWNCSHQYDVGSKISGTN